MEHNFADVESEYKKYPELKREDVKILQDWMLKQPHLPDICDLKLILFLTSCLYSVEATKKCIENYYTFRTHYPPIFQDRDVSKISFQNSIKALCMNTIKIESSDHIHVFLHLIDSNPDLANIQHFMAMTDILTHIIYMKGGASKGHIVVIDGSNVRIGHALKINVTSLKIFLQYTQQALPIQLKSVHVVNISAALEKVYQLAKPFIGKDLSKMIHIHTDVEDLQKHIPGECIPADLGGQGPSYKTLHDDMVKTLNEYSEYIKKDALNKSDESKRVGPTVDAGKLFGIEGTFKKLELD